MNFIKNVNSALKWIDANSTKEYIHVSSAIKEPYNEVTGYFIPTLLEYGDREKANSFAQYLKHNQNSDGSWLPHGKQGQNRKFIFDVAQIVDGLSSFGGNYKNEIDSACDWISRQTKNGEFTDDYAGTVPKHIYPRVIWPLKKAGKDITPYSVYNRHYDFSCLSHFYAYAFEGCARLGWNTDCFVDHMRSCNGIINEKPGLTTFCFTGVSQTALSLFLVGEYDLGMKAMEFVSSRQNSSGGFYGSDGHYFRNDEISWAVKFYLDAVLAAQKCWFKKNFHIFPDYFENGEADKRLVFIRNEISNSDSVLEVGSGKGRYINRLTCNRHACDIIDSSKHIDANFSIGMATNLPYLDDSFDVVFCCESLEHSVAVDRAIEECLRVVKPGGKLLIVDKDNKTKFDGVLFCEQWLSFDHIRDKYEAEIVDLSQEGLFCPFYGAKIIKGLK